MKSKYVTNGQRQKERLFYKVTKKRQKAGYTNKVSTVLNGIESFREIYELETFL